MGDHTPYLYRTRDFGKTWTKIVAGLPADEPSGSFLRAVRADPKRKGLLFAGTESGLHVSFDDGDHWQPLMQNLPNSPYRDLLIKGKPPRRQPWSGRLDPRRHLAAAAGDAGDRGRRGAPLCAG